jgi:hypothetical protein
MTFSLPMFLLLTKRALSAALFWSYRLAAWTEGLSNPAPAGLFDARAATGDARELNRRHATAVVICNEGVGSKIPGAIVPSQATRYSLRVDFYVSVHDTFEPNSGQLGPDSCTL